MKILDELNELLGEGEATEEAANSLESTIAQHVALAAQVAGVDLDDNAALDEFLVKLKEVVTKDKSWLKGQLRRWTTSKARSTLKTTRGAV